MELSRVSEWIKRAYVKEATKVLSISALEIITSLIILTGLLNQSHSSQGAMTVILRAVERASEAIRNKTKLTKYLMSIFSTSVSYQPEFYVQHNHKQIFSQTFYILPVTQTLEFLSILYSVLNTHLKK